MDDESLPVELSSAQILNPDGNTFAHSVFGSHLTELEALLALAFADPGLIVRDTARSRFFLQARIDCIENDLSGPWAIDVRDAMLRWQVVMHVAAVEVYLKEALTTLALFDPKLMRERASKQEWSYENLRTASDSSSVLREFCYRWARSEIDGGAGPRKWVAWLAGIGVPPIPEDDIFQLEQIWGLRHLQVHSGGSLTCEFIRRHPDLADKLYADGLQLSDLIGWRETMQKFVDSVEGAITGRLRAYRPKEIAEGKERLTEYMTANLEAQHKHAVEALGEEEITRRAAARWEESEERIWRMTHLREGAPPDYPGAGWMDNANPGPQS
jgi:hypothetical protein